MQLNYFSIDFLDKYITSTMLNKTFFVDWVSRSFYHYSLLTYLSLAIELSHY